MELKTFETHYEFWLNQLSEKPTIISKSWIENFNTLFDSLKNKIPLFILAPSGIAGANIKEMKTMTKKEAKQFAELGNKMIKNILFYKPLVLGFFDRFLLGGGMEFVLACDLNLSTECCKIGFPESTLGIIPGFFGIDLVHYKNNTKLDELLYTGEIQRSEETKNNMFFSGISANWEGLMIRKTRYLNQYTKVSSESLSKIKDRMLELKNYNTFELSATKFSEMFEENEQIERMDKFMNRKIDKEE